MDRIQVVQLVHVTRRRKELKNQASIMKTKMLGIFRINDIWSGINEEQAE